MGVDFLLVLFTFEAMMFRLTCYDLIHRMSTLTSVNSSFLNHILRVPIAISICSSLIFLASGGSLLPHPHEFFILISFLYFIIIVGLILIFCTLNFTRTRKKAFFSLLLHIAIVAVVFVLLFTRLGSSLGLKAFKLEYEHLVTQALSDRLPFVPNPDNFDKGILNDDLYVQLSRWKFYLSIDKAMYVTKDKEFAYFVISTYGFDGYYHGYVFSKNRENPESSKNGFKHCSRALIGNKNWYWCFLSISFY